MAAPRICRTADDAFRAGWEAPCEHGIPDPAACDDCRLTPEETVRLAVLLKHLGEQAQLAGVAA